MIVNNKLYTADFETTTDETDCRVWAYAMCEIGNINNFIYGNNIREFINICKDRNENKKIYFHNLKFDCQFIFHFLLSEGYTWIKDKSERENKTFITTISDLGQFYMIEVYFEVNEKKDNKVTFYDSYKILSFSVESIAKSFNLPFQKLELDYHGKREIGHILTPHEVDYIKSDVTIMALALQIMFEKNLKKMTIGSDALEFFKTTISNFNHYFPVLNIEIDDELRKSYKGGWTYLSDKYQEVEIGKGIVIDKNSMYPSHMYNDLLPFGDPVYFKGKYEDDKLYPLYIQKLTCNFEIKEEKLPTIQIKTYISKFNPTEYLKSSLGADGEAVTLTLTNVDLELFFEHYNVYDIVWHDGYKFRGIKGLFKKYIDIWMKSKNNAKKDNNGALYLISKLLLNSLYGKFGLAPRVRGKHPYLKDNIVKYQMDEMEIRDSIYVPMASFITSYSRCDIIRTAQKIRDYTMKKYNDDYFIYSDTDSIHCKYLSSEELAQFIDIDDYKLGAYKVENEFVRAKFIRQKCYIEQSEDGKISTTIAGLPKHMGKYINFDNFKKGFTISAMDRTKTHKLRFKNVPGGVVLVDTDFTIKE